MNDDALFNKMAESGEVVYALWKSPVGQLYIIGGAERLTSILFKNRESEKYRIEKRFKRSETPAIQKTIKLLSEYFNSGGASSSRKKPFFSVESSSRGTSIVISRGNLSIEADLAPFTENERIVYRKLLQIPFGKTVSYKKLSEMSGIPDGSRFIGNAMAKNLFPIIIPCHRVIKSDGTRGNYSGGVWIKDYLLEYEQL